MGLIGVGFVALLIRGLHRGVMLGEFTGYGTNDQPVRFALAVIGDVFAIVICAVVVAGYDLQDLWRLGTRLATRA